MVEERLAAAVAGHGAAPRLRQPVEGHALGVRAVGAVTRDGQRDEPRVEAEQPLPGEAEVAGGARRVVLDEDVGLDDELVEQAPPRLVEQVEGGGLLVAVDGDEVHGIAVQMRSAQAVRLRLRALHPHHLGAEVGQQLPGVRRGNEAPQVEHTNAVKQWLLGHGLGLLVRYDGLGGEYSKFRGTVAETRRGVPDDDLRRTRGGMGFDRPINMSYHVRQLPTYTEDLPHGNGTIELAN